MADSRDNMENNQLSRKKSMEMAMYVCVSDVTVSKTTTTESTRTREFGFVQRPAVRGEPQVQSPAVQPASRTDLVYGHPSAGVTAPGEGTTAPGEGATALDYPGARARTSRSTAFVPMSLGEPDSEAECCRPEKKKWTETFMDDVEDDETPTAKRRQLDGNEPGKEKPVIQNGPFQTNVHADTVNFHQTSNATTPSDPIHTVPEDDDVEEEAEPSPRPSPARRRRRAPARRRASPKRNPRRRRY